MGDVKKVVKANVNRTVLVLRGEFPEKKAHDAFNRICGDRLVSMRCLYDEGNDETSIFFYPCRVFRVGKDKDEGCDDRIRSIRMSGTLPGYVDIVKTYWEPVRERAKKEKNDMKWVTMYPVRSIDKETGVICTELNFMVDDRCKDERKGDALDAAADQLCESLRLIASDINSALMASARLVEEVSMDFCEELQKIEDDEIQEKYR